MATRQLFPAILHTETALLYFDFANQLNPGETLSAPAVSASVFSGVDPSPAGVVIGGANVVGTQVSQLVSGIGGVAGCVYDLECVVTNSSGALMGCGGYLAVTGSPS